MGYPSLLYVSKPQSKQIQKSVFEDLQLHHFFTDDVISDIKYPCDDANRKARQDFFASLDNFEAFNAIKTLYSISEKLSLLNDRYAELKSEKEKAFVMISLMKLTTEFEENASSLCFENCIGNTFASFFKKKKESEIYKEMLSELKSVLTDFEENMTFSLCLDSKSVRVSLKNEETYIEKLRASAEKLKIKCSTFDNESERYLSTDIIETLAEVKPEFYKKVKHFFDKYASMYDRTIVWYKGELSFYIQMMNLIVEAKKVGVPFCYASESENRTIQAVDVYDISLLEKNEKNIVPNNVDFKENDSFFFLTGANGGGKTTFLRAVGILTLFYLIGAPLPCRSASIGKITSVYTHFPRDERFDGSGRFVEEDKRVRYIVENADQGSLILLNETYATTNEENAVLYTEKLASMLFEKKHFGLYITHQHGLSDKGIPYLHVVIDENNGNKRTFKVIRDRNAGGSFAKDILLRYGLTAEALEKRFGKIEKENIK